MADIEYDMIEVMFLRQDNNSNSSHNTDDNTMWARVHKPHLEGRMHLHQKLDSLTLGSILVFRRPQELRVLLTRHLPTRM